MTLQIAGNMHQRRELKMNNIFVVPHGKIDAAMGHSSAC